MPIIAVNLGDVKTFENLPNGSYLGEIEKVEHRESTREGKFAQLQVTYLVIDGDQLGGRQSEWLSLSPKAAWRLKRWFAKFGFGDEADLDIDDDTGQLNSPYVIGSRVIFVVRPDGSLPSGEARIRTELFSVEEVPGVAASPAPAPAPARRAVLAPAVAQDRALAEADAAAAAKAERIAAAKAALAAAEAEEGAQDEAVTVPVEAPVAARRRTTPVAAVTADALPQPQRRTTLR